LEIGQIVSYIKQVIPAGQVVKEMIEGYHRTLENCPKKHFEDMFRGHLFISFVRERK